MKKYQLAAGFIVFSSLFIANVGNTMGIKSVSFCAPFLEKEMKSAPQIRFVTLTNGHPGSGGPGAGGHPRPGGEHRPTITVSSRTVTVGKSRALKESPIGSGKYEKGVEISKQAETRPGGAVSSSKFFFSIKPGKSRLPEINHVLYQCSTTRQ